MKNEIERKFFVKEMPTLAGVEPLHYERYFLKREDGVEERISKVNDKYVYERKTEISRLERSRERKELTKQEFNQLKEKAPEAIIREGYIISLNPDVTIQIYHGKFEGLIRAEVEFETAEEAASFIPLPWMGKEMTELPIARDSKLFDLKTEEFQRFLE